MRTLFLLFFVASWCAVPNAANGDIFFFGDSLSDSGNVFNLTSGAMPPAPYVNGRFSNGPTWAESFASQMGASAIASTAGGTNYAFGNATASQSTGIDLVNQIDMFEANVAFGNHTIDDGDLFVVWAGANDIFDAFSVAAGGGDPGTILNPAVANIAGSIVDLEAQGAEKFVVLNSVPIGQTPFYQLFAGGSAADSLDILSAAFNQGLKTQMDALNGAPGFDISQVDMFTFFTEIQADPASFGIANATDSATPFSLDTALSTSAAFPGTEDYLFWDGIHPTATGHQVIADRVFTTTAVPEPSALLFLVGTLGLTVLSRRRRITPEV